MGVSASMVWNTPCSVRLPGHMIRPRDPWTCVSNDGCVKTGDRACTSGSNDSIIVKMGGASLLFARVSDA